jgi:hypothetical protein
MFSVKLFFSIVGLTLKRRTSALKAPEKTPKITIMEAEKIGSPRHLFQEAFRKNLSEYDLGSPTP